MFLYTLSLSALYIYIWTHVAEGRSFEKGKKKIVTC